MNLEYFNQTFHNFGSVVVENVFLQKDITNMKEALIRAIDCEKKYHNIDNHKDYGMVLVCPIYDLIFCNIFDNLYFTNFINEILEESSIVYAYTSSSMPPSGTNFSGRIHVDCPRLIKDYITNIGVTILLDDFTTDNGATWFMPYSHDRLKKPTQEEFYKKSNRVLAPAGSVWFFNARTWHAGGNNESNAWRHALTINFCRPWMKQRLDIPKCIENSEINTNKISKVSKQKLGFHSQIPVSYDEYYVEPNHRKFKQDNS